MEKEELKKQIRVKIGFQPIPKGWKKPVTPVDIDEGTSLEEFFKNNNIPYRNYPARQLNNTPVEEKDFETTILQEADTIMLSTDISGNE